MKRKKVMNLKKKNMNLAVCPQMVILPPYKVSDLTEKKNVIMQNGSCHNTISGCLYCM